MNSPKSTSKESIMINSMRNINQQCVLINTGARHGGLSTRAALKRSFVSCARENVKTKKWESINHIRHNKSCNNMQTKFVVRLPLCSFALRNFLFDGRNSWKVRAVSMKYVYITCQLIFRTSLLAWSCCAPLYNKKLNWLVKLDTVGHSWAQFSVIKYILYNFLQTKYQFWFRAKNGAIHNFRRWLFIIFVCSFRSLPQKKWRFKCMAFHHWLNF